MNEPDQFDLDGYLDDEEQADPWALCDCDQWDETDDPELEAILDDVFEDQ